MLRRLLTVALALGVVLGALPAAATGATGPVDGIALRWAGTSWLGSEAVEGPVQLGTHGGPDGFFASAGGLGVSALPPSGERFVAGRTYPVAAYGTAGAVAVGLSANGRGCNETSGTITVHEVTQDLSGITAVAVDVTGSCGAASVRSGATTGWTGLQVPEAEHLGTAYLGGVSADASVPVTVRGTEPVTFGAASLAEDSDRTPSLPSAFEVRSDGCAGRTVAPGESCAVVVRARGEALGTIHAQLVVPDGTPVGRTRVGLSAFGAEDARGTYVPVDQTRLLDTRSSGTRTPLGPGGTATVPVVGRAGVPTSGVAAAVVNLTSVRPTTSTWLTAWPSGTAKPVVSSLNAAPGRTVANLVTVPVGADGAIRVANASGSTHVLVDLLGWYAVDDSVRTDFGITGLQLQPTDPARVADGTIGPGEAAGLVVDFSSPADPQANDRVAALAVNVTVVRPATAGYLTAWDGGTAPPTTSTLNFAAGEVAPNMALVRTSREPDGVGIALGNGSGGSLRVLVDLVGVYTHGDATGLRFTPTAPRRILDTRTGTGLPKGPFTAGSTRTATAPTSLLGPGTVGLVTNLTGIRATSQTYLTQWDGATPRPTVSSLNVAPGATRAASSFVLLSTSDTFATYNSLGTMDVAQDVMGTFDLYPEVTATPAAAPGAGTGPRSGAPAYTPARSSLTPYRG